MVGFKERELDEWTNLTKSLDMSWMSEVEEIYYTEVCAFPFLHAMNVNFKLEDDGRSYRSDSVRSIT